MENSGLRGLGGAGFPTGRKWRLVRHEPGPRLMAVNADEGEPGTFKDRYYLETDPHRFIEGMLIAAWAIEATDIYIYLRDEYPQCRAILTVEIMAAEAAGLAPHTKIHLRRGAGAYICGEELAMLESIEGRRGLPRHKPPFPTQVGLFGQPTLINNVETLFWVRDIVEKGPDWFKGHGRNGRTRAAQLLGVGPGQEPRRQARPGRDHRARADRRILRRHGRRPHVQGLSAGRRLGRHLAGRRRPTSRSISARSRPRAALSARRGRRPVRPGQYEGRGAEPDALLRGRELRPVYPLPGRHREGGQADEPRRAGTKPLLDDLTQVMGDASICGLGQAAMNPVKQVLKHFREDL